MTRHLNYLLAQQKLADLHRSAERARAAQGARPISAYPRDGWIARLFAAHWIKVALIAPGASARGERQRRAQQSVGEDRHREAGDRSRPVAGATPASTGQHLGPAASGEVPVQQYRRAIGVCDGYAETSWIATKPS
jgi:hypothetical protein